MPTVIIRMVSAAAMETQFQTDSQIIHLKHIVWRRQEQGPISDNNSGDGMEGLYDSTTSCAMKQEVRPHHQ